jgi:hypothetical protein
MVMSLTVTYLLIAVTYLLYLPKFSPLRSSATYKRVKTQLVVNPTRRMEHSAANMVVLLHQVYKSTTDNKREALRMISKATLLISLVLGSITLINSIQISGKEHSKLYYSYQYAYLYYHSLRI